MRHSSIKTTVATLSITVTLLAAAPAAFARPAQPAQKTQTTVQENRDTDRLAAIRQYILRIIRQVKMNDGVTIPIPKSDPSNGQ